MEDFSTMSDWRNHIIQNVALDVATIRAAFKAEFNQTLTDFQIRSISQDEEGVPFLTFS